jgi:hypothetical protein
MISPAESLATREQVAGIHLSLRNVDQSGPSYERYQHYILELKGTDHGNDGTLPDHRPAQA